ncbi:MAG: alpha/beta fold hydrolase, partial [Conexibacter sp.]
MHLVHDRCGSGPQLVLIHGIGSRRGVWDPVVDQLASERETIALDLPGFGDSAPLPAGTEPTVDALVDAVVAFLSGAGIEQPHVAGNSLGGGIALELARRGVVRSVTALSPIGFWSPLERRYGAVLLRLSRLFAEHAQPQVMRLAGSPAGRRVAFGMLLGHPERRTAAAARADVAALAAAPGFWPTLPRIRRYAFRDGEQLRVPVTIGWG